MTNHPNRNGSSKTDAAMRILLKDERSGYSTADTAGRKNISRNIGARLPQDDECEGVTVERIVADYVARFWTA